MFMRLARASTTAPPEICVGGSGSLSSTPIRCFLSLTGRHSPIVDGLVFVGRSGITIRNAMSRSLAVLQQVHSAPSCNSY